MKIHQGHSGLPVKRNFVRANEFQDYFCPFFAFSEQSSEE